MSRFRRTILEERSRGLSPALDRRDAIAWARRVATDPSVVFLDTETTGLGADAQIVEIGVVGTDGRTLLDTLVRPTAAIPPDASRIHGIRDADVRHAPTWPTVFNELCAVLKGRAVIVYNAPFDRRMVAQSCACHDLRDPLGDWQCAMQAFARFWGERSPARGGYRWQSLERAVTFLGVRSGGHRALADAAACRAIVLAMAWAEPEGSP